MRSIKLSALGLGLLLSIVQPVFAQSGCPDGHVCCPPDQQLPCDHNRAIPALV